ncbi:MAG: haloacid dehalogenase-like hydrolase [Opitutales bacterium]
MERKICLLWDIDGTLIWSGGAGERSFERAIKTVFGKTVSMADIDYSGRTDRMISELLIDHIGAPKSAETIAQVVDAYLQYLVEEMAAGTAIELVGVRKLLERAASDPRFTQGLLTGNMVAGAQVKLQHFGLWEFFPFGGFANVSPIRDEIAQAAKNSAAERNAFNEDKDIWVIGDTPHDISCGKHIKARTLAVATGKSTFVELEKHSPSVTFQNLEDTDSVWDTFCS